MVNNKIPIKKHKSKIEKLVNKAISLFEPNSTVLENENIHEFNKYIYAISNLINIKNDFNEDQSIIQRAIYKSNGLSLQLDRFEELLYEANEEIFRKPKEKYYTVFPLKIKYPSLKKIHFILLGKKIIVRSYNYVQKNFNYKKLLEEEVIFEKEIKESLKSPLTYFIIEDYAINQYKASESAFESIELFRSIINFANQYGKISLFPSEPKPLSLIYPPKYFFSFDSNRTYLNFYKTDITFDSKIIDFNSSDLQRLKWSEKLIKKIGSIDNEELGDIIIKAFYLHNDALDYYDKKWHSFLSFWQILELITLSEKDNLKQDETCKRIVSLFKEKDPYEDIIDVLRKKRNNFVHASKLKEFTSNDVTMIMGITQASLLFLINNAKKFNENEDLTFFFNQINTKNDKLKEKAILLNYIKKLKK